MKRAFSVLLVGGLAAFAPAASAESQSVELAPLVSVHARLVFRLVKTDLRDENLFIATDGAASGNFPSSFVFNPWVAETVSRQGSTRQTATLKAALGAGHVGVQTSCTIPTTTGWSGRYEITWYGRGDRSNDFVVTLQIAPSAKPPLCPPEVKDLIEAIEQYANDVLGIAVRPELH